MNESAVHRRISEAIQPLRQALLRHDLYHQLVSLEQLRTFMGHHVFAVWDFMSLLKRLQGDLTCVRPPWVPVGKARIRRLVNEIVLGEESDEAPDGEVLSHFELYLRAMAEAGAETRPVLRFASLLRAGVRLESALLTCGVPEAVRSFVGHTFRLVEHGATHEVAAAFTYGREDLIPDLFGSLVARLQESCPGTLETFRYYLDRHIQLDGEEHGELGREMVALLCDGDSARESEATAAAVAALRARLRLWDAIAAGVTKAPVAQESLVP